MFAVRFIALTVRCGRMRMQLSPCLSVAHDTEAGTIQERVKDARLFAVMVLAIFTTCRCFEVA